MCNSFQNDSKGSNANCDIQQMGSKEKVVVVTQNRENQVPQLVQKWLEMNIKALEQMFSTTDSLHHIIF